MNLVNPPIQSDGLDEELMKLAAHYEIDFDGSESGEKDVRRRVFEFVPRVLERCKDVSKDNQIDYDDMIWIPIVLNLSVYQYDLLLVDEAQDLNRCQQALVRKAGKRLILCGDPKQAIYGFAGADSESMPRMYKELSRQNPADVLKRSCVILPLTVTRRCGKAIVAEARQIVPDFEAFPTNPEGKIRHMAYDEKSAGDLGRDLYSRHAESGDMVLCRTNAPLVSQCFRFLKAGKKAQIQGRDIGAGLVSTVNKMKAATVPELVGKVSDWVHAEIAKERAKRNPNENRIIGIQDRGSCITCFTEGVTTVDGVIEKIKSIFTDDKKLPGIRLSSVHKAKGLESRRVFILEPKGASMPHPMAKSDWQVGQEWNIRYVAITRAIEELVYVSQSDPRQ